MPSTKHPIVAMGGLLLRGREGQKGGKGTEREGRDKREEGGGRLASHTVLAPE